MGEEVRQEGDHTVRIVTDPDKRVSKYPDRAFVKGDSYYERVEETRHLIVVDTKGLDDQNDFFIKSLCNGFLPLKASQDEVEKAAQLLDQKKGEHLIVSSVDEESQEVTFSLSTPATQKLVESTQGETSFQAESLQTKNLQRWAESQEKYRSGITVEGEYKHEEIEQLKLRCALELSELFCGENSRTTRTRLAAGFLRHEYDHFRQQLTDMKADPETGLIEIDINEMERTVRGLLEKDVEGNLSQSEEVESYRREACQFSVLAEIKAIVAESEENFTGSPVCAGPNLVYRFARLLSQFEIEASWSKRSNFEALVDRMSEKGWIGGAVGPHIPAILILTTQNLRLLTTYEKGGKLNARKMGDEALVGLTMALGNPQSLVGEITKSEFTDQVDVLFKDRIDRLRTSYVKLIEKVGVKG